MTPVAVLCLLALCAAFAAAAAGAEPAPLLLRTRSRAGALDGSSAQVVEEERAWNLNKSAVLICDMWDCHWCRGANKRVAELAPRMNVVVGAARSRGLFIVHAPSDTMAAYRDAPQRRRAVDAPETTPPTPMDSWRPLDAAVEPPLPIDDSDGGCDDAVPCPHSRPWRRQHYEIEIGEDDAITDSGVEVYNLLAQRGIVNVMVMGVHTNMCILGRSFGIRRLVAAGLHVVLVRDITDAMYNPRMHPYVSHRRGTDLVIEHIETYWCPTIESTDLCGEQPFRFSGDPAPSR